MVDDVFEGFAGAAAARGERVAFLVQGTLYPDVIESVSTKGPSATIKSHHNVGGLPADMHMELVEPLRASLPERCVLDGEVVIAAAKSLGLADVHSSTIPDFEFRPTVHLNYQESVLPIRDGLPKLKDFPAEFGGSGETLPE